MAIRRSIIVGLLVVVGVVIVAGPALGLEANVLTATDDAETNESSNFGEKVSSFAQSSAVDANETIESGMWEQAVNDTENVDGAIESRLANIEDRIDRLERQSAELEAERADGAVNERAYQARASAIQTQIQNLERSVNHTQRTAERHGVSVNQTALDTLRKEASNMTGPEVSALARNITDAPRGPPDERGPPAHTGPDSESDQDPADDAGSGNHSNQGPPDDVGQNNTAEEGSSE